MGHNRGMAKIETIKTRKRAMTKAWKAKNQEHVRAYGIAYNERTADARREYRAKNREKLKAGVRASQSKRPEYYAQKARSKARKAVKERTRILYRMKTLYGCQICRFREHPCALDFHHRDRTTKKFSLGGHAGGRSWKAISAEIKKCAILCANCHRRVENGDLECH